MKRWHIIYALPLEVWVDIFGFPWISREDFGRLVDRIGNFQFAEHAQFYLHEWGKRKLGNLTIDKDGTYKSVNDYKEFRLDLPQTPLPENIKSFDYIQLEHFNANALDFLSKIAPLLTDLRISVGGIPINRLDDLRTILTHLAPMLDGIQSLYCGEESTLLVAKDYLFRENGKLAKLKKLKIYEVPDSDNEAENVDFILNWLTQPDTDGAKLLEFHSPSYTPGQIFEAIREQFNAATTPSTFAMSLVANFWFNEDEFAEFHLKNAVGEELHGIWDKDWGEFQITRHPANRNTEEVREWIEDVTKEGDDRKICIYDSTVGSIDAAQMVVPRVDEKQGDQQKPCSSKDA